MKIWDFLFSYGPLTGARHKDDEAEDNVAVNPTDAASLSEGMKPVVIAPEEPGTYRKLFGSKSSDTIAALVGGSRRKRPIGSRLGRPAILATEEAVDPNSGVTFDHQEKPPFEFAIPDSREFRAAIDRVIDRAAEGMQVGILLTSDDPQAQISDVITQELFERALTFTKDMVGDEETNLSFEVGESGGITFYSYGALPKDLIPSDVYWAADADELEGETFEKVDDWLTRIRQTDVIDLYLRPQDIPQ